MKIPVLTTMVSLSVLCHAGIYSSAYLSSNWMASSKETVLKKEKLSDPVEIIHFYSDLNPAEFESNEPPLNLAKGKHFVTQQQKSPHWVVDEVTYASYIRDLIVQHLSYPKGSQKNFQVQIDVQFVLDRSGELKAVTVKEMEGRSAESFNHAVLKAVQIASSYFPDFPSSVSKEEQRFSFVLMFDSKT